MKDAHFFKRRIHWEHTGDPFFPYQAVVDNQTWVIRLNEFPDEIHYTLLIDGQEVVDFNNWPRKNWIRS